MIYRNFYLSFPQINEFKDKVELKPLKGAKKSKKTGKPKAEPVVKEEVEDQLFYRRMVPQIVPSM